MELAEQLLPEVAFTSTAGTNKRALYTLCDNIFRVSQMKNEDLLWHVLLLSFLIHRLDCSVTNTFGGQTHN